MIRRAVAIMLLISVSTAAVFTQTNQEAEPYKPEEFPSWANALRRGEIIAFGLLPFAFLFTSLSYQGLRYASGSGSSGVFSGPSSDQDKLAVIGVSLSLSAILALVDYFIDRHQAKK